MRLPLVREQAAIRERSQPKGTLASDSEHGGSMTTSSTAGPRFVRIWRGRTTREKADAYERYWLANGIAPLQAKGALRVEMLRDDGDAETEFVTFSYWDSMEAMTGGRAGDPHHTHHLERDPEFLIELPERVQILKVLETRERGR
jgi:heme-degrading monooxygenase HmoA